MIIIIALITLLTSLLVSPRPITLLVSPRPITLLVAPGPITLIGQQAPYSVNQIYAMIKLIPPNATLMTEDIIFPHLANREHIEFTWSLINRGYFVPDYILVSYSNSSIYSNYGYDAFNYSISNYKYSLYASDGDAHLYRLVGPQSN